VDADTLYLYTHVSRYLFFSELWLIKHSIKQFPWLLPMLNKLPDWWVKRTDDAVWLLRKQEAEYRIHTRAVMRGGDADKTSHVTIFHEILNEPTLPQSEKTESRMTAEANVDVGAYVVVNKLLHLIKTRGFEESVEGVGGSDTGSELFT
jgi:hypothetical protein